MALPIVAFVVALLWPGFSMKKLIMLALIFTTLATAGAQESPSERPQQAVEELSELLLQQKEIIEAQAKELEALRERLSEVEALALTSHNRLQELEQKPEEPAVDEAMEQRLAELEKQVQRIPEAPVEVVDGAEFPGSIPIPGTEAAMKIGGQVRMSVVKTLGPLGVDDKFVTSSIPVEGSQDAGKGSRLNYSARPSRMNFDFRTLTGVGSVRAFIEADFAGDSSNTFRLRHAYGQWGNFLAGQDLVHVLRPRRRARRDRFRRTERDFSLPAASDPMDQASSRQHLCLPRGREPRSRRHRGYRRQPGARCGRENPCRRDRITSLWISFDPWNVVMRQMEERLPRGDRCALST